MSEELSNVITLIGEDGNEVEMELLDVVEYEGKEYVVLLPMDEEDDEVVILLVEDGESEDESVYSGVEDEAVLDAVYAIFKERFRDEFEFTDED